MLIRLIRVWKYEIISYIVLLCIPDFQISTVIEEIYIFRLFPDHKMKVEWMEKVEIKRSDDKQEVRPSNLIDGRIRIMGAREDDRKY